MTLKFVIAGPDPAIHLLRKNLLTKAMDARVISAFTRVFNALCPRMTAESNQGEKRSWTS